MVRDLLLVHGICNQHDELWSISGPCDPLVAMPGRGGGGMHRLLRNVHMNLICLWRVAGGGWGCSAGARGAAAFRCRRPADGR